MSTLTSDDIRRCEEVKEAFNEIPDQEDWYTPDVTGLGLGDIYLDFEGRTVIDGEVVADPGCPDPWDEPNEFAGESPAARQIRLAEMDEDDDPEIVCDPPETLPQAQSDPCPECGICSDLRAPAVNITGVAFDRAHRAARMTAGTEFPASAEVLFDRLFKCEIAPLLAECRSCGIMSSSALRLDGKCT
jgi:hypothetical protein